MSVIRMKTSRTPFVLRREVLWEALWLMISLFLGQASMMGAVGSFGAAVVAAAMLAGTPVYPMAIGATLGAIIGGGFGAWSDALVPVMLAATHFGLRRIKRKPTLGFVAVFFVALYLPRMLFASPLVFDKLVTLAAAGMGGLMIFVFQGALRAIKDTKRNFLTAEETAYLFIFAGVLFLGLDITLWGVHLRNILAFTLVLAAGFVAGPGIAGGSAILLSILFVLSGKMDAATMASFCASAFVAGAARPLKRWGMVFCFILTNTVITFFLNSSTQVLLSLADMLCAAAFFVMIPKNWMDKLSVYMDGSAQRALRQQQVMNRTQRMGVARLREFSGIFGQMGDAFEEMVTQVPPKQPALKRVAYCACRGCAKASWCWRENSPYAAPPIQLLWERIQKQGIGSTIMAPEAFQKQCYRLNQLIKVMEDVTAEERSRKEWEDHLVQSRMLVGQQLKGVGNVVRGLAEELDLSIRFDPAKEMRIVQELDKDGVYCKQVCVQQTVGGRFGVFLEVPSCRTPVSCHKRVVQAVSAAMERPMRIAQGPCRPQMGTCEIILEEAPVYEVMTGIARKALGEVSGDSYSFGQLRDGRYLMALSDGMGSGPRAQKESAATLSLLEQFYESGFTEDVIFSTINQVLLLRSVDEVFSTVDLCLMDLVEGQANFVKIGAVSSYILRQGKVERIYAPTLPMGILEEVQPVCTQRTVRDGDFIIMVTDGVTEKLGIKEELWMERTLTKAPVMTPENICHHIMEESAKLGVGDDMTVMVSRIYKHIR